MHTDDNPYPRRWQALCVLSLSLFVVTVGNTILNVALPTIRDRTSMLARASCSGSSTPTCSSSPACCSQRAASAIASVAGGHWSSGSWCSRQGPCSAAISNSANQLIACRALMGVGAAGIMPTTLSILTNIFPVQGTAEGHRGRGRACPGWASRPAR